MNAWGRKSREFTFLDQRTTWVTVTMIELQRYSRGTQGKDPDIVDTPSSELSLVSG